MHGRISEQLKKAALKMTEKLAEFKFGGIAAYVYNPIDYAGEPYRDYLEQYGNTEKKILFLGMNPGPWGMAQTGVPFGEIASVRDWLGIRGQIGAPNTVHPKRPVQGWECPKSEVSGRRLWGLMKERFVKPERFFADSFVINYCPLLFLEETGRNLTPDKLPVEVQREINAICDGHLRTAVALLKPDWLIGVGRYAERCFRRVTPHSRIDFIIHPSPASPAANRGWAKAATDKLKELGIWD